MRFTDFGDRFRKPTGIAVLMEDLASLTGGADEWLMLGGGNPGKIDAVVEHYQRVSRALIDDQHQFFSAVGSYGEPVGSQRLVAALVQLFNDRYNWGIDESNIALTNGSQNAFFLLFNMLAGPAGGRQRRILLPMTPEYIGYRDVAIGDSFFESRRPLIEETGEHRFKYRIDLDALNIAEDTGAICVSRPTNPTGNVITDAEFDTLDNLATDAGIPLIIDGAYGEPFPDIIQRDVTLRWHPNIILSMSLSKLGLPALRTGILVAAPQLIQTIARMNAVINLTPGSFGPSLVAPLFESGEILDLCQQHIKPFYGRKAQRTLQCIDDSFAGLPVFAHEAEGAIFLWLWFRDLPITTQELYERLKLRGVIVVPGHYFFPGLDTDWQHCHECIRISYAMEDHVVEAGVAIIAEEVKKAYDKQ